MCFALCLLDILCTVQIINIIIICIIMSSSSDNSLYMLSFNGRGMRAHGVMRLQLKPMLLLVDEYVQSSMAHVN